MSGPGRVGEDDVVRCKGIISEDGVLFNYSIPAT